MSEKRTEWPSAEEICRGLDGTWNPSLQKGEACCPAHDDKNPSLSLTDAGGTALWKCWAGCSQNEVTQALKARGIWPHFPDEKPDGRRRGSNAVRKDVFEYRHSDTWEAGAAKLGLEFRYNNRAQEFEHRPTEGGGAWQYASEGFIAETAERMEKESWIVQPGSTKMKPLDWGRHLQSALSVLSHTRQADPFKEWLSELPAWDTAPRLDALLVGLFGCEDTTLNRWASRYIFLASVERTYEPGCLLRTFPVLIGPQGVGKSALLKSVFPPDRQAEWFSDSYLLHESDAGRRIEATLGAVIVEISEMAGLGKADAERVKGDMTRTTDRHRLAYRRDPARIARRFAYVGTSNDSAVLPNDATGNSRYLAVHCPQSFQAIEPVMGELREQLWAEALSLYQKGQRAGLPRDLALAQAAVNEAHRDRDEAIEDALEDTIARVKADGLPVRIKEILAFLDGSVTHSQGQRRVRAALIRAGYEQKRSNGDRIWAK